MRLTAPMENDGLSSDLAYYFANERPVGGACSRGKFAMDRVKIDLQNCYGIKKLQREFDFRRGRVYALYAPNGVMKSSLARTFLDVVEGEKTTDRVFPTRTTVRKISDESGNDIGAGNILVVLPYDGDLGVTERTSTLLVDAKLKEELENLLHSTEQALDTLIDAIKAKAASKIDFKQEISQTVMHRPNELNAALRRIQHEVEEQTDAPFAFVEYDKVFNEKVTEALGTRNLKDAVEEYIQRYNELLDGSVYFKRGIFDYYNAAQIARSLADNGFFAAKHTVSLHAQDGQKQITTQRELEEMIEAEKQAIITDKSLRTKFDGIAKQLNRNAELRIFCRYLQENVSILPCMSDPQKFREDVIKSYIKQHIDQYREWMSRADKAAKREAQIKTEAKKQNTEWQRAINTFNDRFFVPFILEARNQVQVMVGQDAMIDLGFTYVDGLEKANVEKPALQNVLSTGERKALYVLNVIFEIQTGRKQGVETLIVVDDIADSFDYQNKYAIIQYLKDMSEDGLFKMLIMTHNFDFFRTLESRFVSYGNCLMASKNESGITLAKAVGIRNVFANDWKKEFFVNDKKKIASIPFIRNLIEMTIGDTDPHYVSLTSMLHWKIGSATITVEDLDAIYNAVCRTTGISQNPTKTIFALIDQEAKGCLGPSGGMNLENKIVLSIAIRLGAERYMIGKIADPDFLAAITSNQTQELITKFKAQFPTEVAAMAILDKVGVMTPENIHVNSFMYEPIVDMSDDHLRKLYSEVQTLH
jgi:hypothetical protein